MPQYRLIEHAEDLNSAARELAGAKHFFLDTEFESTREGTRLCLLQISRGDQVFIIDVVRLPDLSGLAKVVAAPDVEWVLHSGGQDVPLLTRALGVAEPPALFDTQVVWACTSPEYSVSLAYLVYKLLGIRSAKTHQADDWVRRPLSDRQLAYAATDVAPLPELYSRLRSRLKERGRLALAHEVSREFGWPNQDVPNTLSLDSFRNAWQLDPRSQAALRFIVDWYNALGPAERDDTPETKVLLSIANRIPESMDDLLRIKGVPRRFAAQHGTTLVRGLVKAVAEARDDAFVPIEPAAYGSYREILIDAWIGSLRAEVCCGLEIAPELALPARVLKRLRAKILEGEESKSALDVLEGWRSRLLHQPMLEWIQANPFQMATGRS